MAAKNTHSERPATVPAIGAVVLFCGHAGYFEADIFIVEGAAVVRANGPVSPGNLRREELMSATHHLVDWPTAGFWRPDLGVFVVPVNQVRKLDTEPRSKSAGMNHAEAFTRGRQILKGEPHV